MACSFSSIVALATGCNQGIDAGIAKVWMISYNDLKAINTGTTEVYSASTNGIVNTVGLASGKTYVEIQVPKDTAGVEEGFTADVTKGAFFFSPTFSMRVNDLTIENQTFIHSVSNQPVSVIYKTKSGKFFIAGLNGQLQLSAIAGGTGKASADGTGFDLTFTGTSPKMVPFILDSVVASIVS